MTQSEWQARLTRVVAGEVRRYRDERGMSAQQLADRCQQLGFPIPRPVLSNLENGRRESVTLAEVVVLARALGVSPALLVTPVGRQEAIEILPGQEMRTWDAARWVTGEADLRGTPDRLEVTQEVDVDGPLFLYRLHESWLVRWRSAARVLIENADGELVPDEGLRAELREDAEKEIRILRSRMRKRGLLPPPLPAGLAGAEELADNSAAADDSAHITNIWPTTAHTPRH